MAELLQIKAFTHHHGGYLSRLFEGNYFVKIINF